MLRYVDTSEPGITRRLHGKHWHYFLPNGTRIAATEEIARLDRLAVPPAYRRVWFSADPRGHLQAIGYDAKGRKQYRYHPEFRSAREEQKYDRCGCFGEALPKLRAVVAQDIAKRGLGRDKVLAAIVRLLDHGHIRVGNDVYAQENESYGATTLLSEHGTVRGDTLRLIYRGKSGKVQRVVVSDASLARIVRRCHDLPGQALFQYLGTDGEPHRVGSADVNAYIREAMGDDWSAKNFRTWGASVIAFETIVASDPAALTLKAMLEPVACALGNTPAISRKSYVHPALVDLVTTGRAGELAGRTLPRATRWLRPAERGLIDFLASA